MWIELKKTVQNLIDIESDKKRLNAFVIERYDEKFKDIKIDTGYQQYFKYEIINASNKLKSIEDRITRIGSKYDAELHNFINDE